MRVVITHPEMGIYLGCCLGLGFWTKLDPVGQGEAVTFEDESDARDYVCSWDENNDPDVYTYVPVSSGSIRGLTDAGLEPLLGDMAADYLRYAERGVAN